MINLWAGSSPPVLTRLPDVQLHHLAVFSSRSREEGRERFRMHVGYFDDQPAAERVLKRVREWYPSAWAVPAERHTALSRLPALATLGCAPPSPAVPPVPSLPSEHEAVACSALAIDPMRLPDAEPSLTPRETLRLLEEPAAPERAAAEPAAAEPTAHTFRGDSGHTRTPLAVSEWRAVPKSLTKPKGRSWLQRLRA